MRQQALPSGFKSDSTIKSMLDSPEHCALLYLASCIEPHKGHPRELYALPTGRLVPDRACVCPCCSPVHGNNKVSVSIAIPEHNECQLPNSACMWTAAVLAQLKALL
jgi:hypothetical protein